LSTTSPLKKLNTIVLQKYTGITMAFTRLEPQSVNTSATFTFANVNVTGNLTMGNASLGNAATANYFIGDGSLLTNISGTGSYANSNVANYLPTYTGNISAGNIKTDNLLYANGVAWSFGSTYSNTNVAAYLPTYTGNLSGSRFNSTNTTLAVPGPGNVSGERVRLYDFGSPSTTNYAIGVEDHYVWTAVDATTAGFKWYAGNAIAATLVGNGQLTTVGNIISANASLGNLATANYFSGNGSLLTSVTGANVTGYVATATAANTADTVTTGAQPNITSVGTLSTLNVGGNIDVIGNINVTGNLNYSNVTDLVVGDPLIYLGANNSGNLYDLGIVASYNDGTYYHTGLARNHNDGVWTLFDNVVQEPSTSIDWANATTGSFKAGNITVGNLSGANLITSNYFSGSGNLLSNIQGSNVTGEVSIANTASTVTTAAQPNITSVGTLTSLSVTGNVTSNYFIGNGSTLTDITGVNVTGYVPNATAANTATSATTAGTVTTASQPNITSVGTLTSLTVSGTTTLGSPTNVKISGGLPNYVLTTDGLGGLSWTAGGGGGGGGGGAGFITITKDVFTATGSSNTYTLSITPSSSSYIVVNIDGIVQQLSAYSLSTNVVTVAGMPNAGEVIEITSYGTGGLPGGSDTQIQFNDGGVFQGSPALTFDKTTTVLTLSGNITTTNANLGNIVIANYVYANGSYLTSIPGANVSGYVPNANEANTASTVTTADQPNITSVGTLTSVSVSGNANIGNISTTGSITATGDIIGTYLRSNNSSGDEGGEILLAKPQTNSTIAGTGVTIDVYQNKLRIFEQGGSARGGYFDITALAAGVGTDFLSGGGGGGSYANSNVAAYLPTYTGNVTANYFIGDGSTLTSITGANVTGYVPLATAANRAGTVTTAAQPNITSVGTLTSLSVTGLLSHQQSQETFVQLTSTNVVSGNVDRSFASGATLFFTSSPGANFNLRLTNFTGTSNRATVVTTLVTQSATPYIPANLTISTTSSANTTNQTIKWLSGVTPTGTASKIDAFVFSIFCTASGNYTVLGQSSTYG
jgi:hypothetical protein